MRPTCPLTGPAAAWAHYHRWGTLRVRFRHCESILNAEVTHDAKLMKPP